MTTTEPHVSDSMEPWTSRGGRSSVTRQTRLKVKGSSYAGMAMSSGSCRRCGLKGKIGEERLGSIFASSHHASGGENNADDPIRVVCQGWT